MKVLFIYPSFESIGMQMISSVLRQRGHQVELLLDPCLFDDLFLHVPRLQGRFSYRRELLRQCVAAQPDLVAFSVVTDIYTWAREVAIQVKQALPQVPIVFGGIHATSVPDRVLAQHFADFVCRGEGEYPLLELVEALQAGASEFPIPNIWYKKNGRIVQNDARPLISNLDSLPYPDKELFYRAAPYATKEYNLQTMRGCLNGCAYCHNGLERRLWQGKGEYLRRRSVDHVMGELVAAKKRYGFVTLKIWDEVFPYDPVWLRQFVERYRREIGVPFWCFCHPNTITPETVELLKYGGCWEAEMGVQTLNPAVKRLVGRPESHEQIKNAIRWLRQAGIRVVVDHIFGLPGQSEQDLVDTFRFYLPLRPSRINSYWLRYFPRTPVVEPAVQAGILTPEDIDELEEGRGSHSFTTGGTKPNRDFDTYQTMFALRPYLPDWALRLFERYQLYKRLPSIRAIGHIVTRGINWDIRRDVGGRRYHKHYLYFLLRRLFPRRRTTHWRG